MSTRSLPLVMLTMSCTACGGEVVRLGDGPVTTEQATPSPDAGGTMPVFSTNPPEPTAESTTEPDAGQFPLESDPRNGVQTSSVSESADAAGLPTETEQPFDAGSTGGDTSKQDAATCVGGEVRADEVVWIGDTWVTIPGTQHERVRDLARVQGTIGPDDDFVILAGPNEGMADVAEQYASQQASATKPKLVIMDGGTWDTLSSTGSQQSVANVVQLFEDLLVEMAADGTVQHIIYYLVPALPNIYGVDALREPLSKLCADSPVPCEFVDLQAFWVDPEEFTLGGEQGIQASSAGAEIIADEIWRVMQSRCLLQ